MYSDQKNDECDISKRLERACSSAITAINTIRMLHACHTAAPRIILRIHPQPQRSGLLRVVDVVIKSHFFRVVLFLFLESQTKGLTRQCCTSLH